MDVRLPCDVHVPLIGSGAIREPLEGENYKACRWIEDKSWWFRKEFRIDGPGEAFRRVELTIESLDAEADVFLNGTALGRHRSAFYPLARDVKELLVQGTNTLLVRVTSGLEHFSEQDIAGLKPYEVWHGSRDDGSWGDARRALVRKPQYVYGWDHCPRLATCGIMGEAKLDFLTDVRIGSVQGFDRLSVIPQCVRM